MKKVLAIVLALVMAFSMSAIAFADETTTAADETTTAASGDVNVGGDVIGTQVNNEVVTNIVVTEIVTVLDQQNVCGGCGSVFDTDEALLEHEKTCEPAAMDLTAVIEDVVNAIVEIVKANTGMSGDISTVITKLIDFVAGLLDGVLASESGVNGIIADLEALVADFEIPVLSDLINSLKNLIKDLYAGEICTIPTAPAETPDTGSAPVGIAVFAAVSVAAAAAYVCTKKKN